MSPRVCDVVCPLVEQAHDHVRREHGQGKGGWQQQPEDTGSGDRPTSHQIGGVNANVVERLVVVTLMDVVANPTLTVLCYRRRRKPPKYGVHERSCERKMEEDKKRKELLMQRQDAGVHGEGRR